MIGGILGVPDDGVGRMDVLAHGNHWEVLVDVPGVAREDLEVTVDGDQLVISGERRRAAAGGAGTVLGRFERRLFLGREVAAEQVAADLSDGVLRISLPRGGRTRQVPLSAPVQRRLHLGERLRRPWQRIRVRRGPELPRSLRRLASRRVRGRS